MRQRIQDCTWLLCLLSLLITGTANAAFITDKIVVEVHAERFSQGAVLKTLPSGSSVEVMVSDGKFSRIRTADNITGWIDSKYLTNEKPTQLEYLELLTKSKATEAKLAAAEEKLAAGPVGGSDSSNDDLEFLKKQAQDARWMKVEMMKARDRAEQAEAKLKADGKKTGDNKQALEKLRTQNKELEKRLSAAILVSEQQETESQKAVKVEDMVSTPTPSLNIETTTQDSGWMVNMEWFFGSLVAALIIGFIAGLTWLDKRMRKRHGGFRIY